MSYIVPTLKDEPSQRPDHELHDSLPNPHRSIRLDPPRPRRGAPLVRRPTMVLVAKIAAAIVLFHLTGVPFFPIAIRVDLLLARLI